MFNELTNNQPSDGTNLSNSAGSAVPKKEVDDIFSETDQSDSQGAFSQARPQIEARTVGLGAATNADNNLSRHSGGRTLKKLAIIFIVVVILGTGTYFAYSKFMGQTNLASTTNDTPALDQPTTPTNATTPSTPTSNPVVDNTPVVTTSSINDLTNTSTQIVTPVTPVTPDLSKIDSDNDGLTDSEEQALGTNPNLVDTDNDGLSDYEEVNVYHTNSLKADTDGDGFSDGVEVKGGYNPNGTGKLIQ